MDWFRVFVIALALLFVSIYQLQVRKRKTKFTTRPILSTDEWYRQYFNEFNLKKKLVEEVCIALGKQIGVHFTQIHPSDRFDGDLNFTEWWGFGTYADELGYFEDWLRNYLKINKIEQTTKFSGKTVKDFLVELDHLLREQTKVSDERKF